MKKPLFSILIPVYNVEDYLSECVHSVLQQHFDDCELLLLDDGSTDRSGALCDELQRKYPRLIRVGHQMNAGLLTTRYRLRAMAQGEYYLSLDSDDSLAEGALQRLAAVIQSDRPDMIQFRHRRIDEHSRILSDSDSPVIFPKGDVTPDSFLSYMAVNEDLNAICFKLVRSELFLDFPPCPCDIRSGEDLFQSIPLVERAGSIYYLPQVLYNYRVNTASMTWHFHESHIPYLTVVRPLLLRTCEQHRLCTDTLLRGFYTLYLNRIWAILDLMARDRYPAAKARKVLQPILDCPTAAASRAYLNSGEFTRTRQIIFRLFFQGRFRAVLPAVRFWITVQKFFGYLKDKKNA